MFSEEEISAIFDATLVKEMFNLKVKRDKQKEKEEEKAYRNTQVPKGKEGIDENKVDKSRKERMLMEIEEKRQEYDFKLIKRKFK